MLTHSDPRTTFVIDGLICPKCGVIQRQLNPPQEHKGVVIKGWHKAWWEDDPELEKKMRERWLYR